MKNKIGEILDELENQLGDDYLQIRIDYISKYIDDVGYPDYWKEYLIAYMVNGEDLPNHISAETYGIFMSYMESYCSRLREILRERKLTDILSSED